MRKYRIHNRQLLFKKPAGTSRGVLRQKPAWYVEVSEGDKYGLGECGLLPGLSIDDRPEFESALRAWLDAWKDRREFSDKQYWPSIEFGVETALTSLAAQDPYRPFPSAFTQGTLSLPINGLIWMGGEDDMLAQAREKIAQGFRCIKMKIGAIDFDSEIRVIETIRREYNPRQIEIRVDANGAFSPEEAKEKLEVLHKLDVHSIEQPLKAGRWDATAELCRTSRLPIALDEDLIGLPPREKGGALLDAIRPWAIILKPGLLGGFEATDQWIELAEERGVKWWITSALESNVGLNAIAQFTARKMPRIAQGLGTGSLYTNNPESPLYIERGRIAWNPYAEWENPFSDASIP